MNKMKTVIESGYSLAFLTACHSGSYVNRIAAGAYCGLFTNGLLFWGYGGVKNTETLYAYGLCHLVHIAKLNDPADDLAINVFLPNKGVRRYVDEYVPKWMRNKGLNSEGNVPDAYEAWHDATVLCAAGKLSILKPSGQYYKDFEVIEARCKVLAQRAFLENAFCSLGIVSEGEG